MLKTIIDRVERRPNGLRMILSLVALTPAAAPPNRLQGFDALVSGRIGSVAELASLEGIISDRYEAAASVVI